MPSGPGRTVAARVASAALLVLALVAVFAILLRSGGSYVIHAQFQDAGQLVSGDEVQLGGHPVGSVGRITITPNGLADVRLNISDSSLRPLHLGSTATIGSPGLSGVANRYVRLDPGPGAAPAIPDGGVLTPQQTHGIVDLDTLIDGLDQPSRTRLREILRENADVFAAPAATQANGALQVLDPAFSRTAALGSELVRDQAALARLIGATADVSSTLATRRADLSQGITNGAAFLSQIAARRVALADTLDRTPAVLAQATGVLARTTTTLTAVNPVLRHLQPVAPLAATLLRQVVPVARDSGPAIAAIRRLLPAAKRTLAAFPALARTTVPALASTVAAFAALQPIVTGLRPYAPDLLAGQFEGFGGNQSGYYDANGHYARIFLNVGPGSLAGAATTGSTAGYRTGLTARCPGAASEPPPDNSAPYVPADTPNLCDPSQTPKP